MFRGNKWLKWNTYPKLCRGTSLSSEIHSSHNSYIKQSKHIYNILSQKPRNHLGDFSPLHNCFQVLLILSPSYFSDFFSLPHSHSIFLLVYQMFIISHLDIDIHLLLQHFLSLVLPSLNPLSTLPPRLLKTCYFCA